MGTSYTWYVSLRKLHSCGQDAPLIIRLMMAANDICLANQGYVHYQELKSSMRSHVITGARRYFVRLQCGHLNEALKIIEEMQGSKNLQSVIQSCSNGAQDSYNKLVRCMKHGPDYNRFQKYIGKIRHKLIFHYDNDLINKVLSDRASRSEANLSKITAGDSMKLWRFEAADDVEDTLVCRYLWLIPRNADLREEANPILAFMSDLTHSFLIFSRELIVTYIRRYATTT